ncbi:hypothetical protein AB6813_11420 [bacterium RCC_150]
MTSLMTRLRVRLDSFLTTQRLAREAREAQCRHDGTGPQCVDCIVLAQLYD